MSIKSEIERDADEIDAKVRRAIAALDDPDYPAEIEYIRGVRDALQWVLGEDDDLLNSEPANIE